MHVSEIETPALLVDTARMEQNILRMQERCNDLGLRFRPHIKTHKIPEIARMQLDAGAVGIACQKVSEAEVFAAAGFEDIQIPYNIVGKSKTARLADLALYNRMTVTVDHHEVIDGLAEAVKHDDLTLRVLVELETSLRRTGAQPSDVVGLAHRIEKEPNLHFAGIMVYPTDLSAKPVIEEALDLLHKAGIGVDVVSGGGTGAALHAHEFPELTELRVGTYLFNDWTTVTNGWATLEQCALTVAATVVSRPSPNRAIVDAGSKTLAADKVGGVHGYVLEYPQAKIYQLNEEHGFIDFTACDDIPRIGDRLHIIPAHVCVAVNLHDRVYGIHEEQVDVIWQVAGRGKVW